jgi:hypothetical protein
MNATSLPRRAFLGNLAAAGGGLLILPSGSRAQGGSPNSKLNLALIGTWGRGHAFTGTLEKENVVALCDVDENHLAEAAAKFPGAKTYVDWRKCLEQKDIQAVIICTADHTHAHIAIWAMNRGLHVYCEKPLANSVAEARAVRACYLANRGKLATQVGTQRHEGENFPRVRDLVQGGAIGKVREAHAWGNRQLRKSGYPAAAGEPPKHLHYDLWIGPSPFRPYSPEFFSGGPGMNCLQWNMFWSFGSGQVGDMGSHTMDLVWNALDLTHPIAAEAKGDPFNPEVTPVELAASWDFPVAGEDKPLRVHWHQGGAMPREPRPYLDLKKIGHGAMFRGDKGALVCDFDSRVILPFGPAADMSHFTPPAPGAAAPATGNHQRQWVDACKGGLKTSCDFDYAGHMIEMMLLGLVAYRAGKKISYDGAKGSTGDAAVDALLARTYRDGWALNG